jgi:hypothetical protein
MNFSKKIFLKNQQLIIVSIIIFAIACLNFYLLNKVISGSETPKIIEKNLRI